MDETNNTSNIVRSAPRLIVGLCILAAGLLWTLDNLDVLESEPITRWWPLALIAIGVFRLLDPHASNVISIVLIVLGGALVFDRIGLWRFNPGNFIPMIIAAVGGKLVWDVVRSRLPRLAPTDDPTAIVHPFAFMSGVGRRSASPDFRGGSANAIMGGVELDLRDARIADGQRAVIDAFAWWGGVEIRVPEDWRVVSEVFALMAGFEDKTVGRNGNGPVLLVRGVAIMGAVEVKN